MHLQWTTIVAIAIVVVIALYAIVVFNGLIRARNLVREGWSGIDVQLKRRSELIPNLVATVKAYAAHERGLFEEVTQQRASSMAAPDVAAKADAERALQGSLHRLMAVAEAYPELKADQNFLALQQQLAEIEDQLQMARRYYNGTVRDLNIKIQTFPDLLIAAPLGFRSEPFFEINNDAERAAPTVTFSGAKP